MAARPKNQLLGFNTASGRCCCNSIFDVDGVEIFKVSIPQAVGAVATDQLFFSVGNQLRKVSIPQAVGAVATFIVIDSFNKGDNVSIPQAVGAVATQRHIEVLSSNY